MPPAKTAYADTWEKKFNTLEKYWETESWVFGGWLSPKLCRAYKTQVPEQPL